MQKTKQKKRNPGNTKSAYWNKQSEVQHTHQMTMIFFFFQEIVHTEMEEMNKKRPDDV